MSDIFNDTINNENAETTPLQNNQDGSYTQPQQPQSEPQPKPRYANYYADTVIRSDDQPTIDQPPQYGSYAYVSENAPKPKKKKSRSLLKAAAFVLCLVIVGAGSIQGYKIYRDNKEDSELSEPKSSSESSESTSGNTSVNYDYDDEGESIITLAARTDSKPIPDIVDSIMPSVVGVSSSFEYTQTYSFFGWSSEPETKQNVCTGTGFIISEDGYIVTNAHVVFDSENNAGEAVEVSIMFSDKSEQEAKIIAYDTETDIAVLKVDKTGLTPATLGDSNDLRVGELVIAVGNPLGFELFGSVTSGIVSALNREISINEQNMSLIQIDAPINNGNSGGPLLNSCGQVIGINSAKMSSSYGAATVEGLGFAIPISSAKNIIDDLINYKYVKGRPQIGISTKDVSESHSRYYNIPMGVYVTYVEPESAADLAGIEKGDIIIDIDGEAVKTAQELNLIKNKHKAGDTISITVYRGSSDVKLELTLQEERNVKNGDNNSNKDDRQPATSPRQGNEDPRGDGYRPDFR